MIRYKQFSEPETKTQKISPKTKAETPIALAPVDADENDELVQLTAASAQSSEPLTLSLTEDPPRKARKPAKRKQKNADANAPVNPLPLLTGLDG